MSQGTLYVMEQSPRSFILADLVKHFKLDVKITTEKDGAYNAKFPLDKTPAFIGPKGYALTETIAIASYLFSLVPKEQLGGLLGKNAQQYASIMKYLSLFNQEWIESVVPCFKMAIGQWPFNKKVNDENLKKLDILATSLETRLSEFTFLVGERLTYADLFVAAALTFGLSTILGAPFLKKFPHIARWFNTVSKAPFWEGRLSTYKPADPPMAFTPAKKEKKEKAPAAAAAAAAPAKKEAKAADEEPAPAAAPKPKHPLEALGKPKAPLDEWKRTYSNEETREVAIPWFWKNQYDPEEWSLWKVDYKYNDELTLTFMSNNLIGGFFNRLSASTKYMFGCMVVYGENNNNGITGAFLVRGQDYAPAFDVAPDWESYEFTKLDASKDEDKKFFDNMLAWDEPVVVNGEKREISDGKVFK
ncbi:Elongation factor 1-gamma 2 [Candida parapsilosis]|uniref:Elongation factor 1-gamma 2 n=1 Tax=Candida parapsilosis TaxID=5480 RepID=A0A8X7T8W4_CANPA|nr:Elongation factor 1-gamma 2 [Candida parapsilosis]KAF6047753.1 Elongation factor 1-gamma 2 [Candida parapsilosis]KAF6050279.1 Elongation factor 1-gamma 2 [Candida parapsilosis]KAF6061399.1 Elongation factor 1-gamma 2 [Candida parapsilosis]